MGQQSRGRTAGGACGRASSKRKWLRDPKGCCCCCCCCCRRRCCAQPDRIIDLTRLMSSGGSASMWFASRMWSSMAALISSCSLRPDKRQGKRPALMRACFGAAHMRRIPRQQRAAGGSPSPVGGALAPQKLPTRLATIHFIRPIDRSNQSIYPSIYLSIYQFISPVDILLTSR